LISCTIFLKGFADVLRLEIHLCFNPEWGILADFCFCLQADVSHKVNDDTYIRELVSQHHVYLELSIKYVHSLKYHASYLFCYNEKN
jgi:hypothetical protein